MFETTILALGAAFFWLLTFGLVFARESGEPAALGTRLGNATLLSSLLSLPVLLAVSHMVLFMCIDCTG